MTTLITILQGQHRTLESRRSSIQSALAARDLARVSLELPTFRAALTSHLRLEDTELYPGIVQAAEALQDAHLLPVARIFAQSMKQITEGLTAILVRLERADLDLPTLAKDWASLTAVLESRVRAEERTLFGRYTSATQRLDHQSEERAAR